MTKMKQSFTNQHSCSGCVCVGGVLHTLLSEECCLKTVTSMKFFCKQQQGDIAQHLHQQPEVPSWGTSTQEELDPCSEGTERNSKMHESKTHSVGLSEQERALFKHKCRCVRKKGMLREGKHTTWQREQWPLRRGGVLRCLSQGLLCHRLSKPHCSAVPMVKQSSKFKWSLKISQNIWTGLFLLSYGLPPVSKIVRWFLWHACVHGNERGVIDSTVTNKWAQDACCFQGPCLRCLWGYTLSL